MRLLQRVKQKHNHKRKGLTLVELMLALAGTAFVGAAMSAMLFSITRGTQERTDLRKFVVKQKRSRIVSRQQCANPQ